VAKEVIGTVKTFEKFLNMELNGRIVDEDILKKAINKCVGDKRVSKKVLATESDAFVIREYVEADDVFRAISSAMNLRVKTPDTSIKFDDVRNMALGLDLLEGFRDAEKRIVQQRLSELAEDFNLEKTTDKFLAWRVALCELKIMQLETLTVMNKKEAKEIEASKQLDLLDKQYKVYCESLNVLKRQRDNTKEKPKETLDLTGNINKLDKSNVELQKEVDKARREEQEMIKKLNSKK
jgi:hypothetical protein